MDNFITVEEMKKRAEQRRAMAILEKQMEKEYKQDPSKYVEYALEVVEEEICKRLMREKLEWVKPKTEDEAWKLLDDLVDSIDDSLCMYAGFVVSDYVKEHLNKED